MTNCLHYYGMQEGVDESWLTGNPDFVADTVIGEIQFNFCPLCGKRLREET